MEGVYKGEESLLCMTLQWPALSENFDLITVAAVNAGGFVHLLCFDIPPSAGLRSKRAYDATSFMVCSYSSSDNEGI